MSSNKKIILEFYTALENSDFETLNTLWHDDVTLTLIGSTPVSGSFKGKDSAIKLIENSENKGDFENEEGETYKTELVKGLDK